MPILFLDFDGVINSNAYFARGGVFSSDKFNIEEAYAIFATEPETMIDNIALGHVRKICESTDANIVVTSTWRYGYGVDAFISIFEKCGWPNAPIAGLTPDLRSDSGRRGDEVKKWLEENKASGSYVIIDDKNDYYTDQVFFKTDHAIGLTEDCVDQLIEKLKAPVFSEEQTCDYC